LRDLVRVEIALWDRIDAELRAGHQVSLASFEALDALQRRGDGMRVGEVADALGITIGGASKLVDRLVTAELVTRVTDPADRRAARLTLTPLGRRRVRAATATYEIGVATLLDPVLADHEQARMHEYVVRLLAGLRKKEPT
jgi:DNA-binding MarR family transcriptional regulator